MIQCTPALLADGEKIYQDYESIKSRLHPDQQAIIELRYHYLILLLKRFQLPLAKLRSCECDDVNDIIAKICHILKPRVRSSGSFDLWKATNRYPTEVAVKCIAWLKTAKVAGDQSERIDELEQWVINQNPAKGGVA
jgi:hypothetical protein